MKLDELCRSLLENAPCPITAINPDTSLMYANPAFEKLTGLSLPEIIGRQAPYPWWPEETWAQRLPDLSKLMAGTNKTLEQTIQNKNGERFLIQLNMVRVVEKGTFRYHLAYWLDITERERAEEALRESEEFSTSLLENSPHSIIVINPDTSVRYINPAFEKLYGWTLDEVVGIKVPYPWWPDEDREVLTAGFLEAMKQRVGRAEAIIQKKNKERYWIELNWAPVMRNGELQYLLVNSIDITERKQAEERVRHLNLTLHSIRNINQLITREKNCGKLLRKVCKNLIDTQSCFYAWVALFDESLKLLEYAESNMGKDFLPVLKNLQGGVLPVCAQDALRQSEVVVIKDARTHCRECPLARKTNSRGRLSVRLEYEGKTYGILCAAVPLHVTSDNDELALFREAANDIAFALHDMELEEESKQAEEALRESERNYRNIVELAPDGIMTVDTKGVVTSCNTSLLQLTGYDKAEIIGKRFSKLPSAIMKDIPTYSKLFSSLIKGQKVVSGEMPWKHKDGTQRLCEFRTSLIKRDGKIIGIQAVMRDITERKQAEEALRESEEKFSKAFRSSPDIVSISTLKDGRYIEVNDSFTQITGYSREEAIGRTSDELNTWATAEERDRMIRILLTKGRFHNEEFIARSKSGKLQILSISAEVIEIGGVPCVIAVSTDITERKQAQARQREAENLRELDRLRTELLANISHELRTPLSSIKGFATVLLEYEDKLKRPEKREYLETIDKNTDRLVELIEQLLDMSRLGAGMLPINKSPTSISELFQEVLAEVQVRAPAHRFTLDLPARLPRAHIDARRIHQVLDNLTNNAVKHSRAGTEITLSACKKGDEILVAVIDQGTGIPKNILPRVFERLFSSGKRHMAGTSGAGLGLSICKGLVEAHGGRIWIESEEGKGTTCFFTLPVYQRPGNSHGKKG
jgi:PAS domain S-box-containing protein